MRLTEEKLGSALAKFSQRTKADMSRLAHAVAHLTQAGISLQRWNSQVNQREHNLSRAKSNLGGGLSSDISLALRDALIGIPPFDAGADGDPNLEELRRTAPSACRKRSHKSEKGDS